MSNRVQITVSQILEDLKEGYTRTPDSEGYDPEIGSIMEKYNLTKRDIKSLFEHESLKHKKTRKPVGFVLVDDTQMESENRDEMPDLTEALTEDTTSMQENPQVEIRHGNFN